MKLLRNCSSTTLFRLLKKVFRYPYKWSWNGVAGDVWHAVVGFEVVRNENVLILKLDRNGDSD